MEAISLLGALGALPLDGEPSFGISKCPKPSKYVMVQYKSFAGCGLGQLD